MFTQINNIKIKREINVKNNLYSCCINFGFKKWETVDRVELSYLLKYSS